MNFKIEINKVEKSRGENLDFDAIPFGKTFSDHMFVSDYEDGEWKNHRIIPYGNFSISPANMSLHYGQTIFEGMKATKSTDGNAWLFRPEMHAKRINKSAWRMAMPSFPEELFVQALHELVGMDSVWIPPKKGSALYIRPFMFAMDEMLGVKISKTYRFVIMTGPVGPYYPKPVSLLAEEKYVRAAVGGTGEAKCGGNYGGSLLPAKEAGERGFDQILWLDGKEFKYVQECGTMNVFFVIGDTVVTPRTGGAILEGITRDTFLKILEAKNIKIDVRDVTIEELVEAHSKGELKEAFGAGTAAVVAHVSGIQYKDKFMELPPIENRKIGTMLKAEIDGIRSGEIKDGFGWMIPVKSKVLV